jgi:hypothetical protein
MQHGSTLLKIISRPELCIKNSGSKIAEEFIGKYNGYDVTVLRMALKPEFES